MYRFIHRGFKCYIDFFCGKQVKQVYCENKNNEYIVCRYAPDITDDIIEKEAKEKLDGIYKRKKKMALKKVEVHVDPEEVLDILTTGDIVDYVGESEVLDYIGKESCIRHFGIEEAEE